jgi:hypothetical protein
MEHTDMPNPDRLASERRDFEAAFPNMPTTWRADTGQYEGDVQQYRWQGWLARSAIPIDVSEEMVEAGASGVDATIFCEWTTAQNISRACLTAALTASSDGK